MINKIEVVLASILIGFGSAIILLWLLLAILAFNGQNNGLVPWVASGVVAYGYIIVVLASMVSFVGIIWAGQVSRLVAPNWKVFALLPIKAGFVIIAIGFTSSIAVHFFN
jgi:hypothetical protein